MYNMICFVLLSNGSAINIDKITAMYVSAYDTNDARVLFSDRSHTLKNVNPKEFWETLEENTKCIGGDK